VKLLQDLKISFTPTLLDLLVKYANPATLCEEGAIGPIEIAGAAMLQKAGFPITAATLDKVTAFVCSTLKVAEALLAEIKQDLNS
jgi:hypothetical protein